MTFALIWHKCLRGGMNSRQLDAIANADAFLTNGRLPSYSELVGLLVHSRRVRCALETPQYAAEVDGKVLDAIRHVHSPEQLRALAKEGVI